jgi:hypothetical protein
MVSALVVCVTAPEHELQARTVPSVAAKAPARVELKVPVVPFTGEATKPLAATALPASVTVCTWPGVYDVTGAPANCSEMLQPPELPGMLVP